MSATVYLIENLRRRRRMFEADERYKLSKARESRLHRIIAGEPDDTPPGGWAA